MECDTCRRELTAGDAFFTMTLGLSDTPVLVGVENAELVELTHDLRFCAHCEPKARERFDALIAAIWAERVDDTPELGTELGVEIPTAAFSRSYHQNLHESGTVRLTCGCQFTRNQRFEVVDLQTCVEHERLTREGIIDGKTAAGGVPQQLDLDSLAEAIIAHPLPTPA